jgi:type VI protein secretion system component VasK
MHQAQRMAAPLIGALLLWPALAAQTLRAAPAALQENATQRTFSDYSPSQQDKRSLLDVANPIELMNRLRNLSSMENATSPGDAIDRALKQFDQPGGTRSAPVRPVAP